MPKKQLIEIVGDDECARKGAIDLVESMDFLARAFERGEVFLKSDYLHSSFSLIADVRMSRLTWIELHNRLVESDNMTPTVLITSFPNDRDPAYARQASAICYLAKPFNDEDLLAWVRSALELLDTE